MQVISEPLQVLRMPAKLKILNLNAWLMPFGFSVDNRLRFKKIISIAQRISPDIITFQEVWTQAYVKRFRSALPEYHFSSSGMGRVQNNSGLLTLTKQKPIFIDAYSFSLRQVFALSLIDEWIAKKGILVTGIKAGGEQLYLMNTHLLSRGKEKHSKPMNQQIRQIISTIKRFENVICIGDFNMANEEFKKKMPRDLSIYESLHPTLSSKNPYQFKRKLSYFIPRDETVDHVVTKTSRGLDLKLKIDVLEESLSDHLPLVIDFSLKKAA